MAEVHHHHHHHHHHSSPRKSNASASPFTTFLNIFGNILWGALGTVFWPISILSSLILMYVVCIRPQDLGYEYSNLRSTEQPPVIVVSQTPANQMLIDADGRPIHLHHRASSSQGDAWSLHVPVIPTTRLGAQNRELWHPRF